MNKRLLFTARLFTTILVFSSFITEEPTGKQLFETHCIRCHGATGTKVFFGTGKLCKSKIPDTEIVERIQNGKSIMPAFKNKLKESEIKLLSEYIKTLRTEK